MHDLTSQDQLPTSDRSSQAGLPHESDVAHPDAAEALPLHSVLRLAATAALALGLGGLGALAIDAYVPSTSSDEPSADARELPVAATPPAAVSAGSPHAASPLANPSADPQPGGAAEKNTLERRAARERRRQREMEELRRELESIPDDDVRRPARRPSTSLESRDGENATPRPVPTGALSPKPARPDGAATGPATLTHWNAINAVIEQEEKMRAPPSEGLSASNAGDFTDRRIAAGEFAASGIRTLPKAAVDADLLAFAEKLAAWYSKGVEINKKGKFLLEKADAKTRKGPQGKEWQKQDKEHQQSVGALNAQGEQLRTKLAARHRLTFPPLK